MIYVIVFLKMSVSLVKLRRITLLLTQTIHTKKKLTKQKLK